MFSVTAREGVLILTIIGALIVGAAVKRWRDAHREQPLPVPANPATAAVSPR